MTEPRSYPQTFFEPPPGACRLVVVRHGQSIPYVEGAPFPLVAGQGDPPLSPRGLWQAEQVGQRLRDEPITAIYASSLQRTQQTAAPLSNHLGLPITVDPELREVHLGEFEGGLFRQRSAEGHPAVAAMRTTRDWGEIPGAETNAELASRVVGSVMAIALQHRDEMVAVFCHGGVIGALVGHAARTHPFLFMGSRNGAITYLYVDSQQIVVRGYNDASHIGRLTFDLDPHEPGSVDEGPSQRGGP